MSSIVLLSVRVINGIVLIWVIIVHSFLLAMHNIVLLWAAARPSLVRIGALMGMAWCWGL